ncbi:MAG: O-antigen ligase family protein [Patescibacteria group bacterium]
MKTKIQLKTSIINWLKNRAPLVALIILLIAIPLYPKFPLSEVSGTWVAIRIDDLLVGASLIVWLISQGLRGWPIRKNKLFGLVLLYWLIGLVANFSGITVLGLIGPKLAFLHWARRIEYMSLAFLAFDALGQGSDNNKIDFEKLKPIVLAILVTVFGVFLYGYGQQHWHFPVVSTMNEEFSKGLLLYLDKWTRISSTFAGHYDLATWTVIILPILLIGFFKFKKLLLKLLLVFGFILGFYLLILTASRVSFIAYLLATTVTLLLSRKIRWLVPILGLSLLFGLQSNELNVRLASSLEMFPAVTQKISQTIARYRPTPIPTLVPTVQPTPSPEVEKKPGKTTPIPTAVPKIVKEIRTWPTPEEAQVAAIRSSNIRFQVEWPRAIRAFARNPVLGSGFSSIGLATDNDYLRILAETGIFGLASFLLIIFHLSIKPLITALKRGQNWLLNAAFLGSLTGFLANAIFIDVFESSKIAFTFWILMGLLYRLNSGKTQISRYRHSEHSEESSE